MKLFQMLLILGALISSSVQAGVVVIVSAGTGGDNFFHNNFL